MTPAYWVEQVSAQAVEIRERSLARLVERGILRREDDHFLWVFQTRRYPVINNQTILGSETADHGGPVQR